MTGTAAELKRRLEEAERPRALTGAGVSAESGLPTFRGASGLLWNGYRSEDLATPQAFAEDPKLVWTWYDWRRGLVAQARPNPAHLYLAGLESRNPGFWLITQNVDGLHQAAGSKRILELHGNLWRVRCTGCPRFVEDRRTPIPVPPKCEACGSLLRPDVVWFGEALPKAAHGKAIELAAEADVFLVIGTSGTVEPAASLARLAKDRGAFLIELGPEPSALTGLADLFVQAKAGEALG